MSDSVAAARKLEELRALVEKWAQENPIDVNGQQFFAKIETCVDFSEALKPQIEVYEKTPYRKEWNAIQKYLQSGFRRSILLEFKGRENKLVPLKELKELKDIDSPYEIAHMISVDLLRINRLSPLVFKWRLSYISENKVFLLSTDPIRC